MIDNKANKIELNIEELNMVNGGMIIPIFPFMPEKPTDDEPIVIAGITTQKVRPY